MFPEEPLRGESKTQFAKRIGISRRSLEREIAKGAGPVVTRPTPRREVILTTDGDAWIRARRCVPAE
jgi:hypothetical protein